MKSWSSPEEVQSCFRLGCSSDDLENMASILRAMKRRSHPDKTGGDFENDHHENEYHLIESALDFIETKMKGEVRDLVKLSRSDLENVIRQELDRRQCESSIVQVRSDQNNRLVDQTSRNIRSRFLWPRLTYAGLSGICASIYGLVSFLKDQPAFGFVYDSFVFQFAVIAIFCCSLGLFAKTHLDSLLSTRKIEEALSEEGVLRTFERTCQDVGGKIETDEIKSPAFSRVNYVSTIRYQYGDFWKWPFAKRGKFRCVLTKADCERVADFHFKLLLARGAIQRYTKPSALECYEIHPDVLKQYF